MDQKNLVGQKQKTEEAYRWEQIKEFYELVLVGSEVGIWGYNFLADQAYFSDRFKELMGYKPEELEGLTAEESWSYLHPDFREKAKLALQDHLEGKKPYYFVDYQVRMKSGEYRWFQARGKATRDDQGQPILVAGSFVDIHDQKIAQDKIREQKDAIARMDRTRMLGQLTASIAHEINQPLAGILSNAQAAQLLINKNASTEQDIQEVLDAIVSDTKRASNVIRNIRELYREHKLEIIPFKINEIINQTLQLLNSEFVSNNIKICKKLSPSIPIIKGNAVQIQQVLVNLITNAIEALRDQDQVVGEIHISTNKLKNCVEVWVMDNGPGIPPDKLDQIFQPLATWKSGGMGMGLTISNSIVEAHGGKMMVQNLPTGGCRAGFIISLSNNGEL